jgi:hypothetical protein
VTTAGRKRRTEQRQCEMVRDGVNGGTSVDQRIDRLEMRLMEREKRENTPSRWTMSRDAL